MIYWKGLLWYKSKLMQIIIQRITLKTIELCFDII